MIATDSSTTRAPDFATKRPSTWLDARGGIYRLSDILRDTEATINVALPSAVHASRA
jgi:hypothetical protein